MDSKRITNTLNDINFYWREVKFSKINTTQINLWNDEDFSISKSFTWDNGNRTLRISLNIGSNSKSTFDHNFFHFQLMQVNKEEASETVIEKINFTTKDEFKNIKKHLFAWNKKYYKHIMKLSKEWRK